jgi:polypeptide N-acetylgalactosaminyltransferase
VYDFVRQSFHAIERIFLHCQCSMGMFATSKQWWQLIGGMDLGLNTWGGENIEISLRTWLCGGEIRVARGSKIDHVFRAKFPYKVSGREYRRNLVRIAEAWMDDYGRQKFYKASGFRAASVKFGSIAEQRATQQRLQCKPFSWYLNKFKNRSPVDKAP